MLSLEFICNTTKFPDGSIHPLAIEIQIPFIQGLRVKSTNMLTSNLNHMPPTIEEQCNLMVSHFLAVPNLRTQQHIPPSWQAGYSWGTEHDGNTIEKFHGYGVLAMFTGISMNPLVGNTVALPPKNGKVSGKGTFCTQG